MTISILDVLAIIIIVVSAIALYTIISIKRSSVSKDPQERAETQEMKARFWKDIKAILNRQKSLDEVLNDEYWKEK